MTVKTKTWYLVSNIHTANVEANATIIEGKLEAFEGHLTFLNKDGELIAVYPSHAYIALDDEAYNAIYEDEDEGGI